MKKRQNKDIEEIKEEFFNAMTSYYAACARKTVLEKELSRLQDEENELQIKYNDALFNIDKHFRSMK
jgi:phage shock protein A